MSASVLRKWFRKMVLLADLEIRRSSIVSRDSLVSHDRPLLLSRNSFSFPLLQLALQGGLCFTMIQSFCGNPLSMDDQG